MQFNIEKELTQIENTTASSIPRFVQMQDTCVQVYSIDTGYMHDKNGTDRHWQRRGRECNLFNLVIFLGFFSPLPSAIEVPQGKLILKHFKGKENSTVIRVANLLEKCDVLPTPLEQS